VSAEGDQGFVIRDRRGRGEKETEPAAETAPHPHEAAPPVTFASFVFSLGTSALMLMGEQLDPQQARVPVNLPQAKEIIDILSMLEDKTKGNLGPEERSVLTDMLYALRMKYVALVPGKQTSQAS
jgi:hypothetical protein